MKITTAKGERKLGLAWRVNSEGEGKMSCPRTGLELSICAPNIKRPSLSSCGFRFRMTTGRAAPYLLVGPRLRVTSVLDNFIVYTNKFEILISAGLGSPISRIPAEGRDT